MSLRKLFQLFWRSWELFAIAGSIPLLFMTLRTFQKPWEQTNGYPRAEWVAKYFGVDFDPSILNHLEAPLSNFFEPAIYFIAVCAALRFFTLRSGNFVPRKSTDIYLIFAIFTTSLGLGAALFYLRLKGIAFGYEAPYIWVNSWEYLWKPVYFICRETLLWVLIMVFASLFTAYGSEPNLTLVKKSPRLIRPALSAASISWVPSWHLIHSFVSPAWLKFPLYLLLTFIFGGLAVTVAAINCTRYLKKTTP